MSPERGSKEAVRDLVIERRIVLVFGGIRISDSVWRTGFSLKEDMGLLKTMSLLARETNVAPSGKREESGSTGAGT